MRISDFATEVLNIIGRGGNNIDTDLQARLLPATSITNNPGIINRAILRIARNWAWKELRVLDSTTFSTADGVRYTSISTLQPLRSIVSVRIIETGRSRKLIRINDIRRTDQWIPCSTDVGEGIPVEYSEDNVMIETINTKCLIFNPIPDSDYDISIRYSFYPPSYTSSQTPILTQMDDLIMALAVSMTYSALGEYPQSVFWYQNNYMPLLQEAVKMETTSPDWDMMWLGRTNPPDLGRTLDLQPWLDPFVMR